MSKVLFYCPDCAFQKEIPQSDIPASAKQCICPSCRKTFDLSEVIQSLESQQKLVPAAEVVEQGQQETTADKTEDRQAKHQELMQAALAKLAHDDDLAALEMFEKAERASSTPKARSYLAYCRAKIKYEFADAAKMCNRAIKDEPENAELYLNLARIYLLANMRKPALETIRKGLRLGPNDELMKEFRKFERRKNPIFSSLPRGHFLNRKVGKLLFQVGLR
jgi:tetratricopeptide (TPR) repeat protein